MAHSIVNENEKRVSSYGGSNVLANEVYYQTTGAVVKDPFSKAHVDRTVVVEWGEGGPGTEAKCKIDTGARGDSLPQVMSVPPSVLSIHPQTKLLTTAQVMIDTTPSIQFAEYLRQQPGYPRQQPGYPQKATWIPGSPGMA